MHRDNAHNSLRLRSTLSAGSGATVDLIDTRQVSRIDRVSANLRPKWPDVYQASAYDDQFVIDGNSTLGDELANKHFDAVICTVRRRRADLRAHHRFSPE